MALKNTISVSTLMEQSSVSFGTSGVRGLVANMTDEVCWVYTRAFLQTLTDLKAGDEIGIAGDLRNSTHSIMAVVAQAIIDSGFKAVNYGTIPTPAIALYGLYKNCPTIMVTGSHIPDDRNGIKFNKADGEILKADEINIRAQKVDIPNEKFSKEGQLITSAILPEQNPKAEQHYINRFVNFFPENCLQGQHIGLYEHSSVARDCLKIILTDLGANVTSLARSEQFVAVDTEAIRPEDIKLAKKWSQEHQFDCLISTDGDGDRPLVGDENGVWLRGDIAGLLCAYYLNSDAVVTPISSNSVLEASNYFTHTVRTRIGSPFVIEAMQELAKEAEIVMGYEANGGVLQGRDIHQNGKTLAALPTRDAIIVPLAILMLTLKKQTTIAGLVAVLPSRFTTSDRIKEFPNTLSQKILAEMVSADQKTNLKNMAIKLSSLDDIPFSINTTDGVRVTLASGDIVHFRASGNAPELRCYNEADSQEMAQQLNNDCMALMRQWQSAAHVA
ncbi:MAG: phosphomannomutase [Methylococcales bacterium]|nr:phosphomannomutase [Methylococcales bacterium]